MKKNLTLSIPQPCSEKWETFTPSENGAFCNSCSKIVVDFTKMGDDEIVEFINNQPAHACGRFRSDQLKVYVHPAVSKINPGFTLLKAGLLGLLLILMSKQSSAQSTPVKTRTEVVRHPDRQEAENRAGDQGQTIKGIVRDENREPLPGINVVLKGSVAGTVTDADGRFEFPEKLKEGDVLILNFIGYTTKEYVISEKSRDGMEIPMQLCEDITMMGEIIVAGTYTTHQSGFSKLWSKVKSIF
jgi:hypothetical protein